MQICSDCTVMARFTFVVVLCFIGQCFCVTVRLSKNNCRMPNASTIEPARSLTECAIRFVNDKSSRTFNFHKDGNVCELSARCSEEESLQSDGWDVYSIEGKYYTSSTIATWQEAKTACENMTARLVTIDDKCEQIVLEGILGEDIQHWIGMQCSETIPPNCTWIDGRPMEGGYTNWYPGEPGGRKCVWMGYGGNMWDDDYCDVHRYFICEYF